MCHGGSERRQPCDHTEGRQHRPKALETGSQGCGQSILEISELFLNLHTPLHFGASNLLWVVLWNLESPWHTWGKIRFRNVMSLTNKIRTKIWNLGFRTPEPWCSAGKMDVLPKQWLETYCQHIQGISKNYFFIISSSNWKDFHGEVLLICLILKFLW